jgi:tRNA1(Val) A37 N6-methylase TrmN6
VETARALGAYYTPARLAEPLCLWAVRGPADTVFDPSCGEGAFLTAAVDRLLDLRAEPRRLSDQVAGVELDARALARARGALVSRHPGLRWGRLSQDDFFLFAQENFGLSSFDAVVGNPPFLRTQGRSAAAKRRALRAAHLQGAALTADASAWAPFVAAATGFVRPGGRLAMIVPREALFVNYARPLLRMLERRFAAVHLVALGEHWFEGALVKVALLLGEGAGPGSIRLHEARELGRIEDLIDAAPVSMPARPWVWDRIPEDCRLATSEALESPDLVPLTDLADLSIGVVTGDRDFFLMTAAGALERGLPREFLLPTLSRPSHLEGSSVTAEDLERLELSGEPGHLLAVPTGYVGGCAPLDAYLAEGAARGIDRNYKCQTRKPWYSVRRVLEAPHALMGYLVKWRPRIAANLAGAHSTNNLHRLWFKDPWDRHAEVLCAASLNAATMLSAELLGRVAAGGVLKIEPGDAPRLRLPRPDALVRAPRAAERARSIDRALREGRDWDAYAIADDLAARALGWKPRTLATLRRAQLELRDRRLKPGLRATS